MLYYSTQTEIITNLIVLFLDSVKLSISFCQTARPSIVHTIAHLHKIHVSDIYIAYML